VLIVPGLKPIRASPSKMTIPPAITCNSVSPRGRDPEMLESPVSVSLDRSWLDARSPRPAKLP
jgi:hypothetical protein